jgi:hypothetical protein
MRLLMAALRLDRLLMLTMLAGLVQYAPTAIDFLRSGNVQVWNLELDTVADAGPVKYIKDLFVLCLGLAWPIAVLYLLPGPSLRKLIARYLFWLFALVSVGLLAYATQGHPAYFLVAGLRWLLLAHSAFGLFVIASQQAMPPKIQTRVIRWLCVLGFADLGVALLQMASVGALGHLSLGAVRMTGFFNNAAIGGYFGLALALIAYQLQDAAARWRLLLQAMALAIALSSGTRFAMIAVFLVMSAFVYERLSLSQTQAWRHLAILLPPLALALGAQAYLLMQSSVGRGDLVGSQLEEGGRIANLQRWFEGLPETSMEEFLFGQGLGVGTNTLLTILSASGDTAGGVDMTELQIDNAFVSNYFQFGFIGSLILWGGVAGLIGFVRQRQPPYSGLRLTVIGLVFLLSTFTLNCFEQYYLVFGFMASLAFLLNGAGQTVTPCAAVSAPGAAR